MSADDPLFAFAQRALHSGLRARADRVAAEVIPALRAARADAMLVKGAAIAHRLYAPGQARGYLDCDVLVAPDALDAAGEVLTAAGFHCSRDQTAHPEAWAEAHEQVWRRGGGDVVELHWRLPGIEADPQRAFERLWADRESLELSGAELPVPGPAAAALHIGLHAAQHGREQPRPLVDLATALERVDEATWRAAAALAAELDATDALSAGLRLDPAGAALADRLGLAQPSARWALLAAGADEVGAERLLRWRTARGRERLRLTAHGLFPPREQMVMFDAAAGRGRRALALAYARRLATLPWRLVRAWRAGQVEGESGST